jgi:hypothetical protein
MSPALSERLTSFFRKRLSGNWPLAGHMRPGFSAQREGDRRRSSIFNLRWPAITPRIGAGTCSLRIAGVTCPRSNSAGQRMACFYS